MSKNFYEISKISKSWKTTRLKYVLTLSDKTSSQPNIEKNLSLTRQGIIQKDITSNEGQIAKSYEKYTLTTKGQITMNPMDLLSGWVDISPVNGLISPAYYTFILKKNFDSKFVNYFLQSNYYRKTFFTLGKGVASHDNYGRWVLTPRELKNIYFLYPDLNTQKLISSYLDKKISQIDNFIEKIQNKINSIKESQSIMINEYITKGINFENKINNWKTIRLKYILEHTKGYAFKSELFENEGIPVIKASDIKSRTIQEPKEFINNNKASDFESVILRENDILISTVGSHIHIKESAVGQLAIIPKKLDGSLLNQNIVCLRLNSKIINVKFLFYILNSNLFRTHLDKHAHGTANQASLDLEDILSFKIHYPTTTDQKKITKHLNDKLEITSQLMELEKKRKLKILEYRKNLISNIVTGKEKISKDQ